MTRIIIVETASTKRIHHKIRQILETGVYPEPEISLLCQPGTCREYSGFRGVKTYTMTAGRKHRIPRELKKRKFDIAFAFWTGEEGYRRMKLMSMWIKAGATYVIAGDGNEFRLTWKAMCRHTIFRLKHPRPTDHRDFVMQADAKATSSGKGSRSGERVLILQSAGPVFMLNALERLKSATIFCNPQYTVFCRNRPDAVKIFREHPIIHQVLVHTGARQSRKHLRDLRRQKFDFIVLFMTGDPSYRKIKFFAFLLGVPLKRLLIYNEALDCFFFNWSQWFALVSRRLGDRHDSRTGIGRTHDLYGPISSITKLVLLPFRFLWLLLVWVRLRSFGIKSARKNHDYSLQLPPFPRA